MFDGVKVASLSFGQDLFFHFKAELNIIQQQRLRVAVVVSLLATISSVAYLPSLEVKRQAKNNHADASESGGGKDNESDGSSITSLWSNSGASNAT